MYEDMLLNMLYFLINACLKEEEIIWKLCENIPCIFVFSVAVTCQHVKPTCCDEGTDDIKEEIIKCFEQKTGPACGKHFFM